MRSNPLCPSVCIPFALSAVKFFLSLRSNPLSFSVCISSCIFSALKFLFFPHCAAILCVPPCVFPLIFSVLKILSLIAQQSSASLCVYFLLYFLCVKISFLPSLRSNPLFSSLYSLCIFSVLKPFSCISLIAQQSSP